MDPDPGDIDPGPLRDPALEDVDTEGLKSEILVLIDLIEQVVAGHPIFNFPSLVSGWEPLPPTATQRAQLERQDLQEREAGIKDRLVPRVVLLVVFLMETEGHEGVYREFVTQLEADVVANPEKTLMRQFLGLITEAHRRCREMPNLRTMTRNMLDWYNPWDFLEGEVSEFLETIIESVEQMDIVLRDIPQQEPGDQLEWGKGMMLQCEEIVKSVFEQMESLYGSDYFVEWNNVISRTLGD